MAISEQSDMAKNKAAQALGRLGGGANTAAQQRARKRNAQLAGRPRRVCVRCGEPVVGGHADRSLDDECGQHGWRWQQGANPPPLTLAEIDREIDSHRRALADLTKLRAKVRVC